MSQTVVTMGWDILDRMERAVARVRERLLRATKALNEAGIPYAVVGGHAVASWVATVDEGAMRNTPNVEILVHRTDLLAISTALESVGFVRESQLEHIAYRDGPTGNPIQGVRLLFTGEKLRRGHWLAPSDLKTVEDSAGFRVIELKSLVVMLLSMDRNEDGMHLRDLTGVGLVDQTWVAKLPPELGERLQHILDTPGG